MHSAKKISAAHFLGTNGRKLSLVSDTEPQTSLLHLFVCGQRPRNYSSCCSCWIFWFKNSLNLSLFAFLSFFNIFIFLFFLSFNFFLSQYLSIILLYMSTLLSMSTYLCPSTYLSISTHLPTYDYLPTYVNLPTPTNLHQHTYLPISTHLLFRLNGSYIFIIYWPRALSCYLILCSIFEWFGD